MGIDIDHCITGNDFSVESAEILAAVNSYAEYSLSNTGVHIIVKGNADIKGGRNTKKGIEIYTAARYFTFTGNVIEGYEHLSDDLSGFMAIYDKYIACEDNHREKRETPPINISNNDINTNNNNNSIFDIIINIRKSRQGELFTRLFDTGDISGYKNDASSADMALMNILPFWTCGNVSQMIEIFNLSALAKREKWRKRPDYQIRTVEKALKNWNGKTYDPEELKKQRQKQL